MSEARLVDLIRSHTARLTVIGQGYVGLPLAVEFARAGFPVTGLDSDAGRVAALRLGHSHSPDLEDQDLIGLVRDGRYEVTSDFSVLERSDVVIICVPTPLRKSKDPDISFVMAAAEAVAARFRPGKVIKEIRLKGSTGFRGGSEHFTDDYGRVIPNNGILLKAITLVKKRN